jgi:hypothetical protein
MGNLLGREQNQEGWKINLEVQMKDIQYTPFIGYFQNGSQNNHFLSKVRSHFLWSNPVYFLTPLYAFFYITD